MDQAFGSRLRERRRLAGVSQLDLALVADVSARHVSFLETGRARPSRAMVLRLSQAMDLPLRQRNELLLAAGFAPLYAEHGLTDRELAEARQALEFLLEMHEPYPAFVIDRLWNIVLWNRPHQLLISAASSGALDVAGLNAVDLVFEPGPMREHITNWPEVARAVLARLSRQAARAPGDVELSELLQRARASPGAGELDEPPPDSGLQVLIPLVMRVGDVTLSWFSTLAVFGTAQEVTLSELVIESFFPADESTRKHVRRFAGA